MDAMVAGQLGCLSLAIMRADTRVCWMHNLIYLEGTQGISGPACDEQGVDAAVALPLDKRVVARVGS